MKYERKDAFYARAKAAGYRSRAAYKLLDLAARHRLIRRGDRVLDLGAWPGGWLQVAAELVGPGGRVVGVDLRPIDALPGTVVSVLVGDARQEDLRRELAIRIGGRADVLLSDMAPKLSGVAAKDGAAAADLAAATLEIADSLLKRKGRLLMKLFMGGETELVLREARRCFERVKLTRPEASRKGSSEMYLLGIGFRMPNDPSGER